MRCTRTRTIWSSRPRAALCGAVRNTKTWTPSVTGCTCGRQPSPAPDASAWIGSTCTTCNATIIQIGLAWQLHRSPLTLPIPGTTSIRHFKENIAAATIALEQDEVDEITSLVPENAED